MWGGLLTVLPAQASITVKPLPDAAVLPEGGMAPLVLPEEAPARVFRSSRIVAEGLQSPDGIALDENTGMLYVSEEDPARILRIRPDGQKEVLFDGNTPIYMGNGLRKKKVTGLQSPEGVALSPNGNLYVVEDTPGGRLLRFPVPEVGSRTYRFGRVVPLPIQDSRYAWESVDIGPDGEILLAGSTLEAFPGEAGGVNLFRGILLYRDSERDWWMPMNDAMASYSAAALSPDGKVAFFACEVSGDVGCLDMQSHVLRIYRSGSIFQAPEGLCSLPDGSALVTEEAGRIYRLDPLADTTQLLYDNNSTIESVCWDGANRRLLVSDDQQGVLLALNLKDGIEIGADPKAARRILFSAQSTPVEMIPPKCPDYLSRILKIGGYDPGGPDVEMDFQAFARRYSLVAIDADALLLASATPVADPIKRVQFMIVAPNLLGFNSGQLIWTSNGFVALRQSGQVVKTELVQRELLQVDLMESSCTPMGGQTVALPLPFSARVNADGVASVNFIGMGVMPDFYFVLNTVDPNNSYLVLINGNSVEQYALNLPPDADGQHWVIALPRTQPDVWKRQSFEPETDSGGR